jgi:hypothetical protein
MFREQYCEVCLMPNPDTKEAGDGTPTMDQHRDLASLAIVVDDVASALDGLAGQLTATVRRVEEQLGRTQHAGSELFVHVRQLRDAQCSTVAAIRELRSASTHCVSAVALAGDNAASSRQTAASAVAASAHGDRACPSDDERTKLELLSTAVFQAELAYRPLSRKSRRRRATAIADRDALLCRLGFSGLSEFLIARLGDEADGDGDAERWETRPLGRSLP